MNKLHIFLFLCAALTAVFLLAPTAHAAETIQIWWPIEGATLTGTQPFKAVIDGKPVTDYQMYWSVDNGQHNPMNTSELDWPHKEASVDVSGWNWKERGPYTVTFIAKDWQGATLGQKALTIQVNSGTIDPLQAHMTPMPTAGISVTPTFMPVLQSTPTPTEGAIPMIEKIEQLNDTLYVDPSSMAQTMYTQLAASRPEDAALIQKIASQPQAKWFGGWNTDIFSDTYVYAWNAKVEGKRPVLVLYNIPNRDCGGYSGGGLVAAGDYRNWVQTVANGIEGAQAIVILEPDSLALMDCLSESDKQTRYTMLSEAVDILQSKGASVYLDAGHPNWVPVADMVQRLDKAGIHKARGFTLNTSNFVPTAENITYGTHVSRLVGDKHFVIDTSRNGAGANGSEWCNPEGRALGEPPTLETGNPLVDAYLWIKRPGESDGNCNGGPSAGQWWTDYALGLAHRAGY